MVNLRRIKLPIFLTICQFVFLVLFGILVKYDVSAQPKTQDETTADSDNIVGRMYPSKCFNETKK